MPRGFVEAASQSVGRWTIGAKTEGEIDAVDRLLSLAA
jgi:hypothetical protein